MRRLLTMFIIGPVSVKVTCRATHSLADCRRFFVCFRRQTLLQVLSRWLVRNLGLWAWDQKEELLSAGSIFGVFVETSRDYSLQG